jgi:L-asparaginase/beta-aspartyl-peptidase (threonine type)
MTGAYGLVLHGGAGVNPARDYAAVSAHLRDLVEAGAARLDAGASALETVEWAVARLEASGLYVAGRGSAPNSAGEVEFDACIMDGAAMRAGAVCAIRDVKSPIAAARAVLSHTPHVLLAGEGACQFAVERGLAAIGDDPAWFTLPVGVEQADIDAEADMLSHGTVGAVALDREGRLAAATSTGGLFGKRPGRVGDTPIPGIGTWADDAMALSATGIGEHFILAGGVGDVAARMRYAGQGFEAASAAMLARVRSFGGDGGVIAIDAAGLPHFAYNSGGLKRAYAGSRGNTLVAITAA